MLWGRCLFVAVRAVVFSLLLAIADPGYAWGLPLDAKARGLAHYIMAVYYDLNGESARAISEYQRSIKFNGAQPAPRLKLGAYYLRLDELDKATPQLKAVIRLAPQDTQAHYLLALIYSAQHKYDLAASEYEVILKTAARDNPADTDAYMYLGQLYYAQGKYPQAIGQFLKIVRLDPANTSALYLLGSVYDDNHDRPHAIEMFRKLVRIEPHNSDALNSLGYVYAEQGTHLDEALRLVRKAIASDPTNGAYYDSLGWALYKEGKYVESLAALQKAATYIENEVLYDHIGDVYKALKNFPLACQYWRKSLGLEPHQIWVQRKIKESGKCSASPSIHRLK